MYKVFLTGATGYIGGDILYVITKKHPDWQISCMVRTHEKGLIVAQQYRQHRILYGDNNSIDIIEKEAFKADLIIHCAASDENVESALAISRGLKKSGKGTWIHTSGALRLASQSVLHNQYGVRFDKVFDDWDGVGDIITGNENEPHAKVDNIVLSTADPTRPEIKIAIVAPSVVYGKGRGPSKSYGFPLWDPMIEYGQFFTIKPGDNIWHYVHVQDLSDMYLLLSEAEGAWNNNNSYYLAEQGHFVSGELVKYAARLAYDRGLINTPEILYLTTDGADSIIPWSRFVLGANSRGLAIRERRLLGWNPYRPCLESELADEFDERKRKLNNAENHRERNRFSESHEIRPRNRFSSGHC